MKHVFVLLLMLFSMVRAQDLPNKFAKSDRVDVCSIDISYSHAGDFVEQALKGFSIGLSDSYFYLDGGAQWYDSECIGNAHFGWNIPMTDAFDHTLIITPVAGYAWRDNGDFGCLDYGISFKYSHYHSPYGLVVKLYSVSGVSIGITFNINYK